MTFHYSPETAPIFIAGLDRSGKTTLAGFLASHSHIAIPSVGSNMWTYFYGQYGDLSHPDNFERCLDAMLHYKHVVFVKPDPDHIRSEFWQGEPSYARLFALFLESFCERQGKIRWGDQTTLNERYAEQILTAYPGSKMIQMVRDPRDRYEASLAMWPNGKGKVGGATARWRYSIDLAHRNLDKFPDRYMLVRFETLIQEPESTLKKVCEFLDETYEPTMLQMNGSPTQRAKLVTGIGEGSTESLLSENFIGQYRNKVPKVDVAFMQKYLKQDLEAYGYQIDPIQFTFSEQARFVSIDLPLNLVRMLSWRTVEGLQHNYPAWVGRKPGSRMILKNTA